MKNIDLVSSFFRFIDIAIISISAICVYFWRFETIDLNNEYILFLIITILIVLNIFSWFSLYRPWRGNSVFKEITNLTISFGIVALSIGLLTFLTKSGAEFSRLWVGWTFFISYILMVLYRVIIRLMLRKMRSSGKNLKHIVIVGAGKLGKRVCDSMLSEKWAGFVPVAFFDDDKNLTEQTHKNIRVAGDIDDVASFIETHRKQNKKGKTAIDQVWVALPMRAQSRIEELQLQLQDTATNVYFIPDLYGFNLANYSVEEMIGLPIMNMSASPMHGYNAFLKRLEDIVLASSILLFISPILLVTSFLIKLDSKGPIFFKQQRYGIDGKEFLVWKFRSMTVTEEGGKAKQATRNDSRVTNIGRWLRKLSIDELPQLFNVIEGSMSLVGPRPHPVALNEQFRGKVKGYMTRHQMLPGITGWAQVNGCRGETAEVSQMEERVRYDLEYIRNWSLALDFRILFRTISTVFNTKDTY